MSKLRPTSPSERPAPSNGTAYLLVLNAVKAQAGLIHGRLHADGAHCAIGSFFTVNPKLAMPEAITDEIAMVNDSMPSATPRQRKIYVMRWLRWKLAQIGMVGFAQAGKQRDNRTTNQPRQQTR